MGGVRRFSAGIGEISEVAGVFLCLHVCEFRGVLGGRFGGSRRCKWLLWRRLCVFAKGWGWRMEEGGVETGVYTGSGKNAAWRSRDQRTKDERRKLAGGDLSARPENAG